MLKSKGHKMDPCEDFFQRAIDYINFCSLLPIE